MDYQEDTDFEMSNADMEVGFSGASIEYSILKSVNPAHTGQLSPFPQSETKGQTHPVGFRGIRNAQGKENVEMPNGDEGEHIVELEAERLQVQNDTSDAPESAHVRISELENHLMSCKSQEVDLKRRCAMAESKCRESSSLLAELQSKLDNSTLELSELKKSNSQVDVLKLRLQECERALSSARAQQAVTDSSLRKFELQMEHREDLEQSRNGLEDRLKCRNEQFQMLEEAHSKLRLQLKDNSASWDSERSGLISDLDSLQSRLDSKEQTQQEMLRKLEMVQQAHLHEKSRRKELEISRGGNCDGPEHATAGYEASSVIQKELLQLKETLANVVEAHDKLRSRMKDQEKEFDSERRELVTALDVANESLGSKNETVKHLESDFDRVKGALEVVQSRSRNLDTELKECKQQLEGAWEDATASREALESLENNGNVQKMANVMAAHDRLRSRMQEQEKGFELERRDLVAALDGANVSLVSKDERLKLLERELEGVKGALVHVKGQSMDLDAELKQCKVQLEGACEEAENNRHALSSLEKNSDSGKLASVVEAHENLRLKLQEQERVFDAERRDLVTALDVANDSLASKDVTLNQLKSKLESVAGACEHAKGRSMNLDTELKRCQEQLERAWEEAETSKQALTSLEKNNNVEKMASVVEAHDKLRSRMQEQEKGFHVERRDLVTALDTANDSLASKGETLKQLESELEGVKGALVHVKGQRMDLEAELEQCKEHVKRACEEAASNKQALTSLEASSAAEKSLLLESIRGKDRVIQDLNVRNSVMEETVTEFNKQEESWLQMRRDYDMLQQLQAQGDAARKDLERIKESLLLKVSDLEQALSAETDNLVRELQIQQHKSNEGDRQLKQLECELERVRGAFEHVRGQRMDLDTELKQCKEELEGAREEALTSREASTSLEKKSTADKSLLLESLRAKDNVIQDLKKQNFVLDETVAQFCKQEESWLQMQRDYEMLQQLQTQAGSDRKELERINDSLRIKMSELEKVWSTDKDKLFTELQSAEEKIKEGNRREAQLEMELERVRGALEYVRSQRLDLDTELKQFKEQLEGACEEAATSREALTSLEKASNTEKALLLESIRGKDKVIQDLKTQNSVMYETATQFSKQEESWLQMQRDYELLQELQTKGDADREEMEKVIDSLRLKVSDVEEAWLVDRDRLVIELQIQQEKTNEVDKQLQEIQFEYKVHRDVIRKLEARCASNEREIEEHCLQADLATKKLREEKLEMEKVRKESRELSESMSEALSHQNLTIQQLKQQIGNLEADLGLKDEETISQNERFALLETELKQSSQVQCNMEEYISVMKAQTSEAAEELRLLEDVRNTLEAELRKSKDLLVATKTDLEGKLQDVLGKWTASCTHLKSVTKQLDDESAQKELLLKDLDSKESMLIELRKNMKTLQGENAALQHLVPVLKIKKMELMKEVETSKSSLNRLCNSYEAVQVSLAESCKTVKDLQAKVQHAHKADAQLVATRQENRDLHGYLKAAKAMVEDTEEKLNASEWAVQQLALDVEKAKATCVQKDREEAHLRDELADAERQLRQREEALIEMEWDLEAGLKAKASLQGEIDKLYRQMENVDRGAADWTKMELELSAQLAERSEALAACLLDVKGREAVIKVMDKEIESLKSELADTYRELSRQQSLLCEDLDRRSKGKVDTSDVLVSKLEERLQRLEQCCQNEVQQFQCTLSEVKEELSQVEAQHETLQTRTSSLAEESARYIQKYETLLALNLRKDHFLKDLEVQLLRVEENSLNHTNVESHMQVSDIQDTLDGVSLAKNSENCLLQIPAVEELHRQWAEWKEIYAAEVREKQVFKGALEVAGVHAIEKDMNIKDLQGAVEIASGEVSKLVSVVGTLEAELATLRVNDEIVCEQANHFKEQLQITQEDAELKRKEISVLQKVLVASDYDLKEKTAQLSLYETSINNLQEELLEWKLKLGAAERKTSSLKIQLEDALGKDMLAQQEVVRMKDDLTRVENALTEERRNAQQMTRFEHDLIEERMKTAESAFFISDLQAEIEGWKGEAGVAATERERFKKELAGAAATIDVHQQRAQSMEMLNEKLQEDYKFARDEAFHRKEKMESFLDQLQQLQGILDDSLCHFQMEHTRLLAELQNGGGFDCTDEIDSFAKLLGQSPNKIVQDTQGKTFSIVFNNGESDCHSRLQESQLIEKGENSTFIEKLSADEAQHFAGKLDATLSDVARKSLIIKQMYSKLIGVRSQVTRLEPGVVSHQDTTQLSSKSCPCGSECGADQQSPRAGDNTAEELNRHIDLCDNLIRKNIRLEKQHDSLERKVRALQKQLDGFQMLEKTALEKEHKSLDPVDGCPEQVLRGSRKRNSTQVKLPVQEMSPQDMCKGTILGEIDENVVSVSGERSKMIRRPPVSPVAAVQPKRQTRP